MGHPTVENILDAAEGLFAERGFAETSMRTITSTAGVNLAAVNYHFGTKKDLIQAVFARFLEPIIESLNRHLDDLPEEVDVQQLMSLIVKAVLEGTQHNPRGAQRFTRLLGLAYAQSQAHVQRFIVSRYGKDYRRFIAKLRKAAPQMSPLDFYLRLYFTLGAGIFTLSNFDAIQAILEAEFAVQPSMDDVMERFVPVASAMMEKANLPNSQD